MIRNAEIKDISQIVSLFSKLLETHKQIDSEYYQFDPDYTSKLQSWAEQILINPSQFILVFTEDKNEGKILGFISGYIKYLFPWHKIKSVGHISFLAVDDNYQKKGIGKILDNAAVAWFKNRNLEYIEVYTNEYNIAGINAWRSYKYLPFNKFLRKKIIL